MTFTIYGLEDHEPWPVNRFSKQRAVEEIEAIAAAHSNKAKIRQDTSEQHERQQSATQAYEASEQLSARPSALLAEQVMTTPVVALAPEAMVSEALRQFRANAFRHVPVVSSANRLVGIVSERDILRYLAGLSSNYQPQEPTVKDDARVEQVMTPRVLTAAVDTDVRYIARLFVEHRIGALPIVKDHALEGIITRTNVLEAVMRHYVLELWA